MFSKRQSFICARTFALWIAVVAVMTGCGGGSSQTISGQGNISVSVIGLPANTSVVLQNNGGNNLTVSANGTSSFNGVYSRGLPYAITVSTQPAGATCTVTSNSSGVIPNAAILVAVTCIQNAGIGTLVPVPSVTGINHIPITLDAGPPGIATRQINVPYVSVTVCPPNSSGVTPACQTIDHVQLDTGSTGLRLLNSVLYSNLNLPSANTSGGPAMGECTTFGIGVTWGSVVLADIYLGGEVASNVPIQNIGAQPGGVTAVPADCSNTGAIQITQDALGANGILGVGLFINDCDLCLSQAVPATYYTCYASGCTNSAVTQSQVVQNPVASFANDKNGVLIQLPAFASSGANALSGTLTFGIGTSTNNLLGSAVVYATDPYGNFITTYNTVSTSQSFVDSGSNALFFDDATIRLCTVSTWAYCPAVSPLSLNATTAAATGLPSILVPFNIVGVDQLGSSVVAASIGGPAGGYFDWGLPFFFGRSVYTAISGRFAGGSLGPYFAY
ncbi:DUF3443 family protein [Sideroxydans sp. CL21]|uniref:DUF3443 family protein n=1 Tax=Sideroxydans sp. CL21 TaxID=2600596 RepID=UPI0024BD0D41|nr:DUF3443 family protein [Sideroxydans sp. CL21]